MVYNTWYLSLTARIMTYKQLPGYKMSSRHKRDELICSFEICQLTDKNVILDVNVLA